MRRALVSVVVGAALAIVGCDGGSKTQPAAEPAAFLADAHGDGAEVFLRGRSSGDQLYVDVVAKGPPEINGAALRVLFDPSALSFVEAAPGPRWSRTALSLAKEGTPGQLAIAWAEKGATGFSGADEALLGTLRFQRKSDASSAISFRAERSSIVDKKGAAVEVTFHGGSVPAR